MLSVEGRKKAMNWTIISNACLGFVYTKITSKTCSSSDLAIQILALTIITFWHYRKFQNEGKPAEPKWLNFAVVFTGAICSTSSKKTMFVANLLLGLGITLTNLASYKLNKKDSPAPSSPPAPSLPKPTASKPSTTTSVSIPEPSAIVFSDQEKSDISKARQPLTNFLDKHFDLDPFGYITKLKNPSELGNVSKIFTGKREELGALFYEVSKNGDCAYAEDVKTTLAGFEIASLPVDKNTGKAVDLNNVRPYSYIPCPENRSKKEPPSHGKKKQPRYLGLWEYEIWRGYREFKKSKKTKDHTLFQRFDYNRRIDTIRILHKKGFLLGRVANKEEVIQFMGHRYNMGNDILSTTLWPKKSSPLVMQLFSEFGYDTVGIVLNYSKVGDKDFGVGFSKNALTVGSGFQDHKKRRKTDGTNSISAQRNLLDAFEQAVQNGGSVDDIQYEINQDHSGYTIKTRDVREAKTSSETKPNKVLWNEQTFYRGITRDAFTGFFVKSDSENFSKELKSLFLLQEKIRASKGIFVPIFQFKGAINELEELTPDTLLLNITGASKQVAPIEGRKSQFTMNLEKAGITEEMALKMRKALPEKGAIRSLFELQLLMFNMKDIRGQMTVSVPEHNLFKFEPVKILDNLHLVFPTTHQTKNPDAKIPELHFSSQDIDDISKNPDLLNYLKTTLSHNLNRFLGISVGESTVEFDSKMADLFDKSDVKKTDFAKVLSRAIQAIILFQIYGDKTQRIAREIVDQIRIHWPMLGITPSGTDMILGSQELQLILKSKNIASFTQQVEQTSTLQTSSALPEILFDMAAFNPFTPSLPLKEDIERYFIELGINTDGSINKHKIDQLKTSDPHLTEYEKALIPAVQTLYILSLDSLAKKIGDNIRAIYPSFGYAASKEDLFLVKSDSKMRWIKEYINKNEHKAEFPFPETTPTKTSSINQSIRGQSMRGAPAFVPNVQDHLPIRGQPLRGRGVPLPSLKSPVFKMSRNDLLREVKNRQLIPQLSSEQLKIAKALGLVDSNQKPLWEIIPEFHDNNENKPKSAYISLIDILGHFVAKLMTGPAFNQETLKRDRDSFEIAFLPQIIAKNTVEELMTHTLVYTTEGDKQVLRPNGLQYSKSATVPMGGNIDYNGGNEKHRFRDSRIRRFYAGVNYTGAGAYNDKALKEVEELDQKLLSDEKRRLKRAGLLSSSYISITAEGGYGSPRTPLDRAHRALYIQTTGCQFEKYGVGVFKYVNEKTDTNELEASDFIIKEDANENASPLIPCYYPNRKIPGHADVKQQDISQLDDGNTENPFVRLKDNSLFNRLAFQNATELYLKDLVIPTIVKRTKNQPFYLKATLFGGGFFAEAGKAGNLRKEVIQAMLLSYLKIIQENKIPTESVIEFPRYGEESNFAIMENLRKIAEEKQIKINWTPQGDLCEFNSETDKFEEKGNLVILGAADAMSWSGNEPSSSSVESTLANNSNLRLVMNWWANPKILETIETL